MSPFELLEPPTLREAAALLDRDAARPVSGGTAVMLMMKLGVLRPARLVSLRGVEKRYSDIAIGPSGDLHIGAMTTLAALERSPIVRKEVPVIARTLVTLANVRVRNVATLGGHLAHADPHMDLPPVLIALGAKVAVIDASGGRVLPLENLYSGYLQTTLKRGELIAEVIVPCRKDRYATYLKCTTRSADDWPALGVAVTLDLKASMSPDARIVISAATDVPARLPKAEALVREKIWTDKSLLPRVGEAAAAEAAVVGDAHGSAAYKRELVRVYVERALRDAIKMINIK